MLPRTMLALGLALALLSIASTASADVRLGYELAAGQTLSIPIGDHDYKLFADPAYAGSLRFALLIGLPKSFYIGPYVELEGIAVNTSDVTYQNNDLDARYGRLRFVLGPHLAYRVIERVDVWFRLGIGVDYISGSVHVPLGGSLPALQAASGSSTSFGIEPSLGTTVRVWRQLTIGGSLGFPIATSHSFSSGGSFTAADAQLSVLVGARL